jgi:biopolymer transport protein TolR
MRAQGGVSETITRVNVTPIIDVALVLVIILLVTAPMMSNSDLPVNLPQAATRGAEDERNVSITLGADGRTAVDDQVVDASRLRDVVASRLARPGDAGMLVVVRADAAAPYARVKAALDAARAAGARRLAIATRQRVEARP